MFLFIRVYVLLYTYIFAKHQKRKGRYVSRFSGKLSLPLFLSSLGNSSFEYAHNFLFMKYLLHCCCSNIVFSLIHYLLFFFTCNAELWNLKSALEGNCLLLLSSILSGSYFLIAYGWLSIFLFISCIETHSMNASGYTF